MFGRAACAAAGGCWAELTPATPARPTVITAAEASKLRSPIISSLVPVGRSTSFRHTVHRFGRAVAGLSPAVMAGA
ncbi:hypothetical protein GCM10017653_21130 [Ancylobacter defluvii]|uniref:Uncharacterized protein n=1 Tax=Ancylobacter defluvii TaxID=1282440 RepID=A0A9W6NAW2_9HYPH|nr:hypothetical protein GCM10017653_21130 [Ancylobacter defluvii]